MDTKALESKYQLPTYEKFPIAVSRGRGVYVWDERGTKYLDFYGGHAVVLIGHGRSEVARAVSLQMKRLAFYSNVVYNRERALAAKEVVSLAGSKFSHAFFCNSGTEANEAALKIAKKFTGKNGIISFKGSFHGRTMGALSVTGLDSYKRYAGSLMPGVSFATLGDINSVKTLLTSNIAAIIVEPIQSIAGVYEAAPSFYKELRALCDRNKIILIFDEIQTGLGRTGKMFYGEHVGVTPDIVTLAKGLAGGLPAAATLVRRPLARSVGLGDLGTTFGGGPAVSSAIRATLSVLRKEKLISNAHACGELLRRELAQLPRVTSVTGKGLLLGVVLDTHAQAVQEKLIKAGIIVGTSKDPYVLRLMPPLVVKNKEVMFFIRVLKRVLNSL